MSFDCPRFHFLGVDSLISIGCRELLLMLPPVIYNHCTITTAGPRFLSNHFVDIVQQDFKKTSLYNHYHQLSWSLSLIITQSSINHHQLCWNICLIVKSISTDRVWRTACCYMGVSLHCGHLNGDNFEFTNGLRNCGAGSHVSNPNQTHQWIIKHHRHV